MKEKIKKIINIIKNIFIFTGLFLLVSMLLSIFQELSINEIKKGNFNLGVLLRWIGFLPLFIFCAILAFKIGKRKKKV